ncbi:MAG: hypothetical protein JO053_08480 [Acidobacteria bacterium]|nr:hypothetical protein [Acidobacteriota bacterium]
MKKLSISLVVLCALALLVFALPMQNSIAAPAPSGNAKVCKVITNGGADATVVATGRHVTLAKGTSLILASSEMHQGYIAVNARVGGKMVRLSIMVEETNCFD